MQGYELTGWQEANPGAAARHLLTQCRGDFTEHNNHGGEQESLHLRGQVNSLGGGVSVK